MSSQNDLGFVSLLVTPTAGISQFIAIDILSDGSITPTSGANRGIGVTQENAPAGRYVNVKLWSAPGTFMLTVSPTIVTPGNFYSVITGGYAGNGNSPTLKSLQAGVSAAGIVLEFTPEV